MNQETKFKDALGTRMKEYYEDRYRIKLPRRTNIIVRLDGRAFHTLLKDAKKPFDAHVTECMKLTAEYLLNNITGAKLVYTQSDEISVLITDYDSKNFTPWYDNNLQKICSITASMASVKFSKEFGQDGFFDSRVFIIPEYEEVKNYFVWRQLDCKRNALNLIAQQYYTQQELSGVKKDAIKQDLEDRGDPFEGYERNFSGNVNGYTLYKGFIHVGDYTREGQSMWSEWKKQYE